MRQSLARALGSGERNCNENKKIRFFLVTHNYFLIRQCIKTALTAFSCKLDCSHLVASIQNHDINRHDKACLICIFFKVIKVRRHNPVGHYRDKDKIWMIPHWEHWIFFWTVKQSYSIKLLNGLQYSVSGSEAGQLGRGWWWWCPNNEVWNTALFKRTSTFIMLFNFFAAWNHKLKIYNWFKIYFYNKWSKI